MEDGEKNRRGKGGNKGEESYGKKGKKGMKNTTSNDKKKYLKNGSQKGSKERKNAMKK